MRPNRPTIETLAEDSQHGETIAGRSILDIFTTGFNQAVQDCRTVTRRHAAANTTATPRCHICNQGATVRTVRTLFFPDNVRTTRVRYFALRCRTLLYDENKLCKLRTTKVESSQKSALFGIVYHRLLITLHLQLLGIVLSF